jgi:TolB-like protein
MGSDEKKAFELLRRNRQLQKPIIEKYRGKWLKEMGDGILASFDTASDAVRCAGEIQNRATKENIGLRIGIHTGEVVFEGGDVLGDGVNVASRLEELAEAASIYISGTVYKDIKNKEGIKPEFIEEKTLKNVDEPVKVYRVECEEIEEKKIEKEKKKSKNRIFYYFLAGIIVILVAIILWQFLSNGEKDQVKKETETVEVDKSIAVLPFTDISPDKDQEYFSDGMMDAILMHLSKIGDLEVKSRTSVMQYKGTIKTTPQIAEELGVANILEGSVSKSGDRIRIIAQLIDAKNDKHLWAETYEKDLSDVFAIQSEVAQKIATSLKVELSSEAKERIEAAPTENMIAYDYYLKGNQAYWSFYDSMDVQKLYESKDYFEKAVETDDEFSFGYTGLGRAYTFLGHFDSNPSPEVWNLSKKYLGKAIILDPYNGWAYAELGNVLQNWDWDTTAARMNFEMAVKLMPNDLIAYFDYYWLEYRLGNCKKMNWMIDQMRRIDPSSINNPLNKHNLMLLACEGKYDIICEMSDKYLSENMNYIVLFHAFTAYLYNNKYEKAEKIIQLIENYSQYELFNIANKGILNALKGDENNALILLEKLQILSKSQYVPNYFYAAIYAALGDKRSMYNYLEESINKREFWIHQINYSPAFTPYHHETQFQEVLRKMWIPLKEN